MINVCALLVLWPWFWPLFNKLYSWLFIRFFSSFCLIADLFWLRIYLSPHVDISSYCIKKNVGESKQASIFQQVSRHGSPTQISKKRKGVRVENGEQIYLWEQNPLGVLGLNQILDCGYFFSATVNSYDGWRGEIQVHLKLLCNSLESC